MAILRYQITSTLLEDNRAEVSIEVIDATDVPAQIFVTHTADDAFSHVATVRELRELKKSREDAQDTLDECYLRSRMIREFETVDQAAAWRTAMVGAIQSLNANWDIYRSEFPATELVTVTS